jgi:predicted amidophosphoribosyltransferase
MKIKKDILSALVAILGLRKKSDFSIGNLSEEVNPVELPGPFGYSRAISRFSFDDFHRHSDLGKLMKSMKNECSRSAADRLIELLIEYLRQNPLPRRPELIIPLPDSILDRSFKSTEYMADALADYFGCLSRHDIVCPIGIGQPQKERSIEERLADSKPRYEIREAEILEGRVVLLLDDIYASGRSMIEAGELINQNHPEYMMALAVIKLA